MFLVNAVIPDWAHAQKILLSLQETEHSQRAQSDRYHSGVMSINDEMLIDIVRL